MKILLFRSRGFLSSLIKWQTRSEYSHAAVWSGTDVYHALFSGVQKVPFSSIHADFDIFDVSVTEQEQKIILEFLEKQVGKKYDFGSLFRFISREQEDRTDSGKWFCSELVFAAFQKCGVDLLKRIEAWAVSPGMLRLSPLLNQWK